MVARIKATQCNETPNIPNAKYPTGIIIDLKSPPRERFPSYGAKPYRLLRELGLSAEEIAEFKREQASATTYPPTLTFYANGLGLCLWVIKQNIPK